MLINHLKKHFSTLKPKIINQLLINGKFVDSVSEKTFPTINPFTEEKIIDVQEGDQADINLAVNAARNAFNGIYRKMSAYERGLKMLKLADLIEKNIDDLATLESLDNGKPFSFSRNIDIQLAIKCLRYYAGYADKVHGQTIPIEGPYFCYTRHEPVGVVGQIIPWNFPMLMLAWKLGPALAMGCTVIVKPAEQTPLTALRVGELIMEAGFPEGVVNIVPGYGPTAGAALVEHEDVDKIAFTGSTEVGLQIISNSSRKRLKRVTLELGGKSANIIMDDADLDLAIRQSQLGLFLNQGQCCIAGSRLFVHENIYEEFVRRSVEEARKRVVGDPFAQNTNQGPQIDCEHMNNILNYISIGSREGAKLLTGGKRLGKKGYFIEPTVFSDVKDEMTIAKEEIFGPVMSILKFSSIDEVIMRANRSLYGLGAGVVTRDIEKALKLANGLQSGTVYVNCYDVFDSNTPFGGFKNSGMGRELGEYGLVNYTEVKTVIIKRSKDSMN